MAKDAQGTVIPELGHFAYKHPGLSLTTGHQTWRVLLVVVQDEVLADNSLLQQYLHCF